MREIAEFGISREVLSGIAASWRSEASAITGVRWSVLADVGGSGSDVLAAIRDCAEPAGDATRSIGERFSGLAQKVDTFAADVVAQDGQIGAAIDEFPAR